MSTQFFPSFPSSNTHGSKSVWKPPSSHTVCTIQEHHDFSRLWLQILKDDNSFQGTSTNQCLFAAGPTSTLGVDSPARTSRASWTTWNPRWRCECWASPWGAAGHPGIASCRKGGPTQLRVRETERERVTNSVKKVVEKDSDMR